MSIYQGIKEGRCDAVGLRVKTEQLIQFLPVQMLLLNPRNTAIVSESENTETRGPSVVAKN